jgi:hypothetical protein
LQIEVSSGEWRQAAILFLEADPWFFRSGYLKVRLLRALKRSTLSARERERLRQVIVAVVDSRHRQEFRAYGQLAARIATDDLHHDLRVRLESSDAEVRRRAAWMLTYVEGGRSKSPSPPPG